jgi:hypothetical protein
LDLLVPAVGLRLPSEDRRAYWTEIQTTTGLPRFTPVRCDRGGCFLYSGVLVSAHEMHPVPCQARLNGLTSLTPYRRLGQPPIPATGSDGASSEVHLYSPVRSSPSPAPPDGSGLPWTLPPAFARFVTLRLRGSGTALTLAGMWQRATSTQAGATSRRENASSLYQTKRLRRYFPSR